MSINVGDFVVPGDVIKSLSSANGITLTGPGLHSHEEPNCLLVTRAGTLCFKVPNIYWVEGLQQHYYPKRGDLVVGIVTKKAGNVLKMDIGSSELACLPLLGFEGATKKQKPDLQVGDVVYARLLTAHREMESELVCVDSYYKAGKLGPLSSDGFVMTLSLNFISRILNVKCALLRTLAKRYKYEIAVGMNGKWWGSKEVQPILALHGWQDNAGTFDTLAPLLKEQNISILAIDLPGHGFSTHYSKGQYYYLFWDGVICLRRIVKYFNWTKITIMGHSLGGGIGFLYAAVFPDEVHKYIALDIPAPPTKNHKLKLGETIDRFLKYENLDPSQNSKGDYEEMLGTVEDAYKDNLTRTSCEIMLKRGLQPVEKNGSLFTFTRDVRLKVAALSLFSLDQVYDYASRITCEVLNIKANSGIFPNEDEYYDSVIDKMKASASKVEYHQVPGTHHVHLNYPDVVSEIIINFINSD
ncbi:hypothetical protein FQA39_LY11557 [Lamprigera yunnana]|nr:hypothetical protein FQA39_LY11557 [Lamprigera yunnana]